MECLDLVLGRGAQRNRQTHLHGDQKTVSPNHLVPRGLFVLRQTWDPTVQGRLFSGRLHTAR